MWKWLLGIEKGARKEDLKKARAKSSMNPLDGVRILKHAQAMRVVFFYPGEEGTYVDDCMVTLFENGVVHLRSKSEETTTHLHHCEILWRYENPVDKPKGEGSGKVRVLNFKNREGGKRDPEAPKDPGPGNGPKKPPTPPSPPAH
ncbi:MAG: hypothetical protein JST04_03635 [Bdellovibrionales bacterium]|nr:hypothetical protein [Bdellovibrionales bacterium]